MLVNITNKIIQKIIMSIDSKTTKHICNVIRRQVQNCHPDLYIHFIIHKENGRQKIFNAEENAILDHDAGEYMVDYLRGEESENILENNASEFNSIAYYNSPGFLGFLKSKAFIAVCFINYEHFNDEGDLRNHAIHLTWHAISVYNHFLKNNQDEFNFKNNIITPQITKNYIYRTNLNADIFSVALQTLQGRDNALNTVFNQIIEKTLHPKTGFIAEKFIFPVCIDTLEFVLKNNIEEYKNSKKTVLAATRITEDVGNTYEDVAIAQWRSFSLPAQEMAWIGYDVETILGAAIYTGDNTFTQVIADMIAERLNIKPKIITSQQGYNPFTNKDTNEQFHKKQYNETINHILDKTHDKSNYINFIEEAQKQNTTILNGLPTGWCAGALLKSSEIIKQANNNDNFSNVKIKAKEVFDNEVDTIKWSTLVKFTRSIFTYRRNGRIIDMGLISKISNNNNEYEKIYETLSITNYNGPVVTAETKDSQNITDFINPNAIK